MREAFERALRESPDDLAGWCAYADYLVEQGDPRGEFMQVQLALEDESRPKEERDALKAREAELLAAHQREWLGEFAPFVFDQERDYEKAEVRFARGWPCDVSAHYLSVEMVRALGRSPAGTFLSRLLVDRTANEEPQGSDTRADGFFAPGPDVPSDAGEDDAPALHALLNGPLPARLRAFRYGEGSTAPGLGWEGGGSSANGGVLHEAVARMPRLEELYVYAYHVDTAALFALPLPNLRILRVDHETEYPFEVLAANRRSPTSHTSSRTHTRSGPGMTARTSGSNTSVRSAAARTCQAFSTCGCRSPTSATRARRRSPRPAC